MLEWLSDRAGGLVAAFIVGVVLTVGVVEVEKEAKEPDKGPEQEAFDPCPKEPVRWEYKPDVAGDAVVERCESEAYWAYLEPLFEGTEVKLVCQYGLPKTGRVVFIKPCTSIPGWPQ